MIDYEGITFHNLSERSPKPSPSFFQFPLRLLLSFSILPVNLPPNLRLFTLFLCYRRHDQTNH